MNNLEVDKVHVQKGLAFEQFIVSRFDNSEVSLYNWQGDKSYMNVYPETNKHPDLVYKINNSGKRDFFAVECKWRRNDENGIVAFAKGYQLDNYSNFVDKMRVPLFIVIGLCGKPSAPANLFVIPFKDICNMCSLDITMLRMYQRNKQAKFYWDEKRRMII